MRDSVISGSVITRFHYINFCCSYEERFRSLETIVRDYKMSSTFEDFAGQVFSPGSASAVTHSSSRSGRYFLYLFKICFFFNGFWCNPIENQSLKNKLQYCQPPLFHGEKIPNFFHLLLDLAAGNSWSVGDSVDMETSVGVSPRLSKKPSAKGAARRSMIVSPSLTPPDSPTLRKSK